MGQLTLGRVVDVDEAIAIHAAKLNLEKRLTMADALIHATALLHGATVVTQDGESLPVGPVAGWAADRDTVPTIYYPGPGVLGLPNVIAPAWAMTMSRPDGSGITHRSPVAPARIAASVPWPPSSSEGTRATMSCPVMSQPSWTVMPIISCISRQFHLNRVLLRPELQIR